MKQAILQLEEKLNDLNTSLSSLQGQCSLLTEQCSTSEHKLKEFEHNRKVYKKSVELLTIVEQHSKDTVIKGFQTIVDYALSYILANDEYKLKVSCDRRGSLQTIDFDILTPGNKEAHKPGGFVTQILSLALRIALIEITRPKIEGFLIFDEPFKDVEQIKKIAKELGVIGNLERASQFLQAINRKLKRQMIIVSHKQEFIDMADKAIEIKRENNVSR